MKNSSQHIQQQLIRLRNLLPPGADLYEFAAQMLDEEIAMVEPNTSMGIVPPSILSKTQILASARIAAELIDTPDQLATKPEGIVDLGVIGWLLRPALPLRDNIFTPVKSGIWKHLPADLVKEQSSAVCRLDISINESDPIQIGTGFVVGKDKYGRFVIATNAHVVEEVIRIGWLESKQIVFGCDFSRFAVDKGGDLYKLDDEYNLHSQYDMALLYLQSEFTSNEISIKPLPIASTITKQIMETNIGVIGHPSFDSRRDPFPSFFGFGNEFGIKRFSPGFIRSLDERVWIGNSVNILLHDATTLSGSSGSCILDLSTLKVVGLHFGGFPLPKRKFTTMAGDFVAQIFESNGAIPLWLLQEDTFCSDFNFV